MAKHFYTQQIAETGRISTDHYVDEINIINELRQIVEDLASIIGQERLDDGQYPADGSAGLTAANVVKNNFDADDYPLPTNDETEGYRKGSIWIYNDRAFICVNSGEDEAIWKAITQTTEQATSIISISTNVIGNILEE